MRKEERIILASDGLTLEQTLKLMMKVGSLVYGVKIHSLWDEEGSGVVEQLKAAGADTVWVDLKLKDIPETVRLRAKAVEKSGANILTVHTDGGVEMMMAARETDLEIYGVTVLTSLSEEEIQMLTGTSSIAAVLYRARLAKMAKLHGVVCSPNEVATLNRRPELKGLKFIVPGIRSAGVDANDQQRIGTPEEATAGGATHLVIGRQITKAEDAIDAIQQIFREIDVGEKRLSKKGNSHD